MMLCIYFFMISITYSTSNGRYDKLEEAKKKKKKFDPKLVRPCVIKQNSEIHVHLMTSRALLSLTSDMLTLMRSRSATGSGPRFMPSTRRSAGRHGNTTHESNGLRHALYVTTKASKGPSQDTFYCFIFL